MSETIFHKIIRREIPADILHEDELCIAIRDIQPVSPCHILIIPKQTIPSVNDLTADDRQLVGHLVLVAQQLAAREGVDESGYRLVFNCGSDGSQSVFQLHLHLVGGREFGWPPG